MESEFSRIENLPKLATRAKPVVLTANLVERQNLAERAGIPAIEFFETSLKVTGKGFETFEIAGRLKAGLTLTCGRSLKDFGSEVDETFTETFISQAGYQKMAAKNLDERDDYEVFEGDEADLGEMAAQLLILAIDPFPHLEGDIPEKIVTSGVSVLSEEQARLDKSPFSNLKKLQKKT
ncbi:MAG: YceD family protein [Alphaproteobacteria bacterium]